MAVNYQDEIRRGQQAFGSGSTGRAGANAFKAAYERLKQEANLQRQNIGQDYAQTYQQLRQQQYRQGLGGAAGGVVSGGQAAGLGQQAGAAQIAQLGGFMQGQERALREQSAGEASIYSNALLEGQQAQEYAVQQEQQSAAREAQAAEITKDSGLDTDEKIRQLRALNYTDTQINNMLGISAAIRGDVGMYSIRGAAAERDFNKGLITYEQAYQQLKSIGRYTEQQILNRLRRSVPNRMGQ